MHKSNSTYFADLDVSRSHLVTHLLGPAIRKISVNEKHSGKPSKALAAADQMRTGPIMDKNGRPVRGTVGIMLGSVFCSFRKELPPLRKYEMWSRILAWDRKWLYIVTHYVPAGLVRPTGWDSARKHGPTRGRIGIAAAEKSFASYVVATAVSKYVFKLGRFTIHPAIVLEENDLLPERPGLGWRGGEDEIGIIEDSDNIMAATLLEGEGPWDWKQVERARIEGMKYAEHFAALDGTNDIFSGGEDGALGRFPLG
jgi:hypothetical protein